MDKERNFDFEFSTIEKARENANTSENKMVVTKDDEMYYVVDAKQFDTYQALGYRRPSKE